MTKRIFRSICLAALGVLAASVTLFLFVLYDYFEGVQQDQLRIQTELAAQAVANEGLAYFDGLDIAACRLTWIRADGKVLFDSQSDSSQMENHLEREEMREALATGVGESARYSATRMERAFYCAKRLPDGSVIRLSVSQNTLLTLFLGMMQPLCAIVFLAILLAMGLALSLSRQIVKPLNALDLERPLSNDGYDGYDELAPLLHRIDRQQRHIQAQERELVQKRQEFETVTENMTEGIILLNARGEILEINRAAQRLFGADSSCLGQHLLSLYRSPPIVDLLLSSEAGRKDERMLWLAGSRYQLMLSPVKNGETRSGSVLLVMDVTEKEKAEQMRREFTANVSHELKTPLHTIAGSAELLANGIVKEADRIGFYLRIQEEARRMIRLVDDIIRLSHLDEGIQDAKREPVELLALARQTLQSLQPEADQARLTLTLDGEAAVVYGIPQLLRSILFNLCDNAIQYNRPGGSVSVTVGNETDQVTLIVADTGIGIPPEQQERVFERFYRVDKSRSKALGGTGLGLSIVKHAARLHHARIDLHSAENKGTTIRVAFPKRRDGDRDRDGGGE